MSNTPPWETHSMDDLTPVSKLTKDLRAASRLVSREEARYLVRAYYQIQGDRLRSGNRLRASGMSPTTLLSWYSAQQETLEAQVKRVLGIFAESQPIGQWLLSITGVGPVIAAGLLAHIDIERTTNPAKIWRFAGLDPTSTWKKGTKRPWNADLKVLCWKAGQSFVKTSSRPSTFYGPLYLTRKRYEWDNNRAGNLSEQARAVLATKRIASDTDAFAWYAGEWSPSDEPNYPHFTDPFDHIYSRTGAGIPMLPPAHIHARACRWTVKLFLSHLWQVWYELHHGQPAPRPYAIAHLEHSTIIAPPPFAKRSE